MSRLPESGSSEDRIRQLERRVQQLERADRMGNTSFREPGALRFLDAVGNLVIWVGTLLVEGVRVGLGLLIRRPDGTLVFTAHDNSTALYHGNGEYAVYTDLHQGGRVALIRPDGEWGVLVNAGGLDFPRIPVAMYPPSTNVPDGDWMKVGEGRTEKVSSHLRARFFAVVNTDEEVQVRLRETFTSTVIGTHTFTSSAYATITGPNPRGLHQDTSLIVEARRSSGTSSTNRVGLASVDQIAVV